METQSKNYIFFPFLLLHVVCYNPVWYKTRIYEKLISIVCKIYMLDN
jgi:hypothetical protein